MSAIVAPHGSPLSVAVLSVVSLRDSLAFYCDVIGFEAAPTVEWFGPGFEALWQLPRGASAHAALLTANRCPVGRILLLEFSRRAGEVELPSAERIHAASNSQVIGLANLNFYCRDVRAAVTQLAARGYEFWSEPTQHSMTTSVGNPIEVLFDGPDGVTINLVELASRDPDTRVGQMRAYVESQGYTARGFTPVVTSSHVVHSIPKARAFYERVLRMGVLFEDTLSDAQVNAFLRLPSYARTSLNFMQGNHMFGKIALSQPLNYEGHCVDLRARARVPNIGYLAQIFEVTDFEQARAAYAALKCEVLVGLLRTDVPGLSRRAVSVVRNPGSGALQWLISALPKAPKAGTLPP